ncbi:heterogeneous nuclear ribonucleoprotein 1-like [Triticum dicoccoides]|uniref:heterogeneous nuclear ribonucleoprotein 1-like n=1 Tax=Triticum dicoccoides TaxID=85692 RepID=UPI0003D494CB|nr:heterogeneous nuclear ribonucleoprotein 1-like [Triticum dicoccoides]XP_044391021.1 heterogeneous nuclear ribonucleoprotein 1-like [Triticum aestivum]XP_044391022.1 heterogeneous nuclear ribonucleoprotein 1-like [Triticum aestivum]
MSPAVSRLHINGRLYVDGMAPGTGDADLRRHFGRYGDVADICIPTHRLTGQPRCCAFVQFSSPRDAGCALADPHHVINGREVYVARARPRHLEESSVPRVQPNNSMTPAMSRLHINGRLYLDDMAPGTSDADLRRHFGRYGDVADIFIPTYSLTGQPRCCAFVQFSSPDDAGRALADPHHVINGREVYIGRAEPRHLEESSVCQYKPLCKRQIRDGQWRGYRVGDIGKTSFGPIVYDSIITYISEDGVDCWCLPVTMHTESKSTGYGPRKH